MTYGARTWSANEVLELDTDSFTYQVIHNQLYQLTMGAVITVPIVGFDPEKCCAVVLPTQPATNNSSTSAMPYQSVGMGVVTVRSKHPNQPSADSYGSTIQFRLLVMRHKN